MGVFEGLLSMELLVLRHGKSSWADLSLSDKQRPLKKRGKRDSVNMGAYIRSQRLIPDLVLSSTAVRADQTTRRALKGMGASRTIVRWSDDWYHGGPETWISALRQCPSGTRRVMIVGHNPGLEELVLQLSANRVPLPEDGKLLPTAALAHFEVKGAWHELSPGKGLLIGITRPRNLIPT